MDLPEVDVSSEIEFTANNGSLVQQRFPVGRHPSRRSRHGLIFGVRMRGRQPHTLDHRLLVVIVEPTLAWLEAGNDRMPRCRGVLGRVLAQRTVAASDVPALRAPAEMKPPTFRRRQAFHTPIAARLRSGVDTYPQTWLPLDADGRIWNEFVYFLIVTLAIQTGMLGWTRLEGGLAEREGFEPPIALRLCLISSQVHSTGLCHLSAI